MAIMGTYLKKSRNDNKAVSEKCVRSGEVPGTFEIQMKAGHSKFEIYVLEHLETRGKKREALFCMF